MQREQCQFEISIVPLNKLVCSLSSFARRSVDEPVGTVLSSTGRNAPQSTTHLRLTLARIFFLKLSLVTNSSVSSLRAKLAGGSLIFRFIHNCFTTSSTVSVGSIRARTVRPSPVETLLVGTKATGLTGGACDVDDWPLVDMNQRG